MRDASESPPPPPSAGILSIWGPHEEPIAAEGWPFIGACVVLAALGLVFFDAAGFFVGVALTIFVMAFFRNPERTPPDDPDAILSAADGRVVRIGDAADPLTGDPMHCVSVFMSAANCHVNRAPVSGTIGDITYRPGKYHTAMSDAAQFENEQNCMSVLDEKNRRVVFTQVAGIFARRIVCYLAQGQQVARGQRIGLIRFGSRVDHYVPTTAAVDVNPGDKVRAGETILARFTDGHART